MSPNLEDAQTRVRQSRELLRGYGTKVGLCLSVLLRMLDAIQIIIHVLAELEPRE